MRRAPSADVAARVTEGGDSSHRSGNSCDWRDTPPGATVEVIE